MMTKVAVDATRLQYKMAFARAQAGFEGRQYQCASWEDC
jgi:hypothetical protein